MSHDDIRAALVRDQQRGGRFPSDPELQHKAADWLAELLAENERLTARAEAAEQAVQERNRLLAELTDPDPCWFDHNGGCQAHGFLSLEPGQTCPMNDAQGILRALDGGEH